MRAHWPDAGQVEYRWSTQDYMTVDRVPYVGQLSRDSRHVTAATGFNKWGLTSGTVAAMILSDRVLERDNDWAELFDARRLKRSSAVKIVKEGASSASASSPTVSGAGPGAPRTSSGRVKGSCVSAGGGEPSTATSQASFTSCPGLPTPLVHRFLESRRADVGLSVSRLSLHGRGADDSGSGREGSGANRVIDHVVLNISDYEASKHFYVEALRPLGYNVILEFEPIA
jgi:hypothetical protein